MSYRTFAGAAFLQMYPRSCRTLFLAAFFPGNLGKIGGRKQAPDINPKFLLQIKCLFIASYYNIPLYLKV